LNRCDGPVAAALRLRVLRPSLRLRLTGRLAAAVTVMVPAAGWLRLELSLGPVHTGSVSGRVLSGSAVNLPVTVSESARTVWRQFGCLGLGLGPADSGRGTADSDRAVTVTRSQRCVIRVE
jgi:hypothetical protein